MREPIGLLAPFRKTWKLSEEMERSHGACVSAPKRDRSGTLTVRRGCGEA